MSDKFNKFRELRIHRAKSFKIVGRNRDSSILVFTPHGGGIELATTEICEWFGEQSYAHYSFTGWGKIARIFISPQQTLTNRRYYEC